MSALKIALAAGVSLMANSANAQMVGQLHPDAPVRIQTSVNFFVAGPMGDSEEAQKSRDAARRSVYEMAGRECALLRDVIAKECRIESISINIGNVGRPYAAQQPEGYTVNGSMNFQIIAK
jgi:hypothetical protein